MPPGADRPCPCTDPRPAQRRRGSRGGAAARRGGPTHRDHTPCDRRFALSRGDPGSVTMQSRRTPRPAEGEETQHHHDNSSHRRGRSQRQRQRPTGRPAGTDPGHQTAAVDPGHHRLRHLLRRLHRAGHRLRDAATGQTMGPEPRRGRADPVRRVRRPTRRRDRLRLPRRKDRPAAHPADHHRAVRLHGHRLPVRLERCIDDAVPVPAGHRHRRRGPRRLRVHQRIHRRQETRPVLPALRTDLPDRAVVRRYLRLLPGPELRLEGTVHRRPHPRADHDPAAGPDARIPPLAGLQGPHRQGRQDRLHAGERSGQGRQTPPRTGDPAGRPEGHPEVGLAGAVQGHLPQAHPDDLGAVDRRLHHQQRHDHLAAHPVHPGVRRARCRPACSTGGPPPRSVSPPPSPAPC